MATLSISSIRTLRQFRGFHSYPRRGQEPDKQFRAAFSDLSFGGTADLIAEGDYLVGNRSVMRAALEVVGAVDFHNL
jgi:hypothetical protein